jgi:hypothetical protein
MTTKKRLVSAAVIIALGAETIALPALANVPDAQVNRLGADLTPIGAEKGGEGDIPAWTGGLTTPPAGYKKGGHLVDPYAGDPVKFTVTPGNAAQYDQVLSTGYKALLKAYPTYKMNVYQTRRSCAYPDNVYQATKNNARVGLLVGGGNGVSEAIMGFPFPIPNNALEIIWNHTLRYRSFKLSREFATAPVTRGGSYTLLTSQDEAILSWSDPSKKRAEELNNISLYYISNTIAPARAAGNVILVHETLNRAIEARAAWQYSPGTRRVRRAPDISYDNPGTNTDGLSTADAFDGFNGAPDRYDWTVIGKKPMIIAANDYKAGTVKYSELLRPLHLNQDHVRYELHRVWHIEAKLKPSTRHLYARRVYYNDEDNWSIANAELYDARGTLWRVQEEHNVAQYQVPLCAFGASIVYDLQAGRYLAQSMQNEQRPINFFDNSLSINRYTPSAIKQLGVR